MVAVACRSHGRRYLNFEVWDRWLGSNCEGRQQQEQRHAWALLALRELASLAEAVAATGGVAPGPAWTAGSTAGVAVSRSCLLPLVTEWGGEPAASSLVGGDPAAARDPALRVDISYRAESCVMDASAAAAAAKAAAAACLLLAPLQQDLPPLLPRPALAAGPAPSAARPVEVGKKGGYTGSRSSSSDSEADENSVLRMNNSSCRRSRSGAVGPPRQPPARQPAQAAPGAGEAAGDPAAALSAVALAQPAPPPSEPSVEATLSVEVIRACGLATAVHVAAAAAALSSGPAASSLAGAKASGPHAFARLTLFPTGG